MSITELERTTLRYAKKDRINLGKVAEEYLSKTDWDLSKLPHILTCQYFMLLSNLTSVHFERFERRTGRDFRKELEELERWRERELKKINTYSDGKPKTIEDEKKRLMIELEYLCLKKRLILDVYYANGRFKEKIIFTPDKEALARFEELREYWEKQGGIQKEEQEAQSRD